MVDFKKKIRGKSIGEVKIHPCEIYETLDRASDKGPLREIQKTILDNWFDNFREKRDVILKLHTGQGKTIIGLLLLQSRLNQNTGPALYLCPTRHLVEQTAQQADSFGIKYVLSLPREDLPDDFIEGKSILITTANKLFTGLTKFELGTRSREVPTIVMDDAHLCIEYIKKACRIKLSSDMQSYKDILELFSSELKKQGEGSLVDIKNGDKNTIMAVPYWDWQDKSSEVLNILSNNKELDEIKFAWPLIKDDIKDCRCVISGSGLEITPYIPPLEMFGSYYKAEHRIFMSATVNDDSFFINGLGLDAETIENPLALKDEKWSGEKMILIPSLIDDSLNKTKIVNFFARPVKDREFGVVALVPSSNEAKEWEKYGSTVALSKKEYGSTISTEKIIINEIQKLKNKHCENPLVIVNRYDGIDLPDHACRVLVLSNKPYGETLEERYLEDCRINSDVITMKLAQIVEQGIGRSVRGEKDYCTIIITGRQLVKLIKGRIYKKFFSNQTKTQIEIGLQIAEFAKEDIKNGESPIKAFVSIINQQLGRDDGWKNFYTEQMDGLIGANNKEKILAFFQAEKQANDKYQDGDYSGACDVIQKLIDEYISDEEERGWYLQEMARYIFPQSRTDSNNYQITAHKKNRYLFKPKEGICIIKLSNIGVKRVDNIIKWVKTHENFDDLKIDLGDTLGLLRFGVHEKRFVRAFEELGKILGFISQRPENDENEGPDNFWKIKDNQYLLVECKNKAYTTRKYIYKKETGQMNTSCAWFDRNYRDAPVKNIMIAPTRKLAQGAYFNCEVEIMRKKNLDKLTGNVENFYKEFQRLDFNDLSHDKIHEFLNNHKLDVGSLLSEYSEKPIIFK